MFFLFIVSRSLRHIRIFIHPMICLNLNVRQHKHAQTYGERKICWRLQFFSLSPSLHPSLLALEPFMVLYANSTVCHEVFKNSANFYGFFRTIHFTRVVFFAFVCRYLNVYILFQSTMIHAFNRKLIYLIAIPLSRQLIWFIKMQCWALFLLALFFALFYSFVISLCVWIKDYYHHIACVHTLPLSDCRVKWKWIFVWRNENICATLTE